MRMVVDVSAMAIPVSCHGRWGNSGLGWALPPSRRSFGPIGSFGLGMGFMPFLWADRGILVCDIDDHDRAVLLELHYDVLEDAVCTPSGLYFD